MTDRVYSLAEANELLPHLATTLIEMRDKVALAGALRERIERTSKDQGLADLKAKEARAMERVEELLLRIQEWNLILRDIDAGLIDFPGQVAGRDILLCWRLGEPEVAHWHDPDAGFAGRRSIAEL